MGDSADFPRATPAVSDATRLRTGDCVHVYRGSLADAEGRVRLFVLAPDAPAAAETAFERAATAWERCSEFPGIVPVLARGDTPRHWIAVATVDGSRLPETALPLDAQRHVIADVAEGLRSAHRAGYHHLGVTPSHVWVVGDAADGAGTGYAGRLDWALERACVLAVGDLSGPYVPPELLDDADGDAAPARADVYGLGAVAAETMTGSPSEKPASVDDHNSLPERGSPAVHSRYTPDAAATDRSADGAPGADDGTPDHGEGGTPSTALPRSLPDAVDDVVTRALAADPADRYQSIYAFKRALLFEAGSDTQSNPGSEAGAGARDGDTHAAESPDSSEARAEREDDPDADNRSLVHRRSVLGALGIGAAGTAMAGGAWLFGTSGTDDGDAADGGGDASQPDVTDSSRQVPNAQFAFALQPLSAAVIYEGGDPLPAGELFVRSDALYDGERAWSAATGTDPERPVQPGESVQFAVQGEYEVRVVWEREDAVLASARGPVDPQDPSLGDVTTVQYDPGNTGFTLATVPAPSARRRWRFETDDRVRSSPAVVDGVVYFGSNDGSVYAVDARTGTELWSVVIGSQVWASPTVARFPGPTDIGRAATRVFVGNTDGTFYSLDARDGSTRWRAGVGDSYLAAPDVVSLADDEGPIDGTVAFVGGSDRITAFNAREGIELWSFEAGRYVSGPGILPPRDGSARDRTTVFVASSNDTVYALDAHDGRELWSSPVKGVATLPTIARPFDTPPDRPGYTVFLGSGLAESRGLFALAAADGSLRWHLGTENDVVSSPAVVDERMAVAAGGTVFAGDRAGTVYAADARDGSLRWSADTDGAITAPPVVADTSGTEWSNGAGNTLYLGSWDGNVYGF
ncbi:MAG: PQQ-binding-like beta-propeller repeat protein, partial [Halovenus sp.]